MMPFKTIYFANTNREIVGLVLVSMYKTAEGPAQVKFEANWSDEAEPNNAVELYPVGMGSADEVVNYIHTSVENGTMQAFAERVVNNGKLNIYNNLPSMAAVSSEE